MLIFEMRDTQRMIADYMEGGFLENIIDMFRAEPALWSGLSLLLGDERGRVRLGAIALIEEFIGTQRDHIEAQVAGINDVLRTNDNPSIRGDAAYALELVGGQSSRDALSAALESEKNYAVREAIQGALDAIGASS